MKQICTGILLFMAICFLSGCTTTTAGVEEMLRAPQLAGPQRQVQKALNSYLGEVPQLKYPLHGDTLSPFIFGDWDGNGTEDAAALYVTQGGGQNVHLAILEQTDSGWVVTQECEGVSTSVESVDTAAMHENGGTQLLVGYSASSGEKYLAVYSYQDGILTEITEQPYSQYELQDITGSGLKDLILIGPESGEGLHLQLLTTEGDFFAMAQELNLSPDLFASCEGLYASQANDGSYYLVLDGKTGTGTNLASMIFRYNSEQQQLEELVLPDGRHIYNETQRYSSLLKSLDINGDGSIEIPHEIPDTNGLLAVSRLTFLEWMDYTDQLNPQKSFGIADLENGYYLALPSGWNGQVMITDGEDAGSWTVRSLDGETTYLEVRMASPGLETTEYTRLGNIGAQKVQARILEENIIKDGWTLSAADLAAGFLVL